jgi:hypothetical protein
MRASLLMRLICAHLCELIDLMPARRPPTIRSRAQPTITSALAGGGDAVTQSDDESPAPVPRPRGRPKKAVVPLFDPSYGNIDFSLTVAVKNGHVLPLWLDVVFEVCQTHGVRGSFSLPLSVSQRTQRL